jgi:ribosome-associated protein
MAFATDDASLRRTTDVEYFVAGGPGGQHRNKTATGVRLRHRPSGVRAQATERRSRAQNLAAAWERLRTRIETLNFVPAERKATRPTHGAVEKRLRDKAAAAERKRRRRPAVSLDD